mmetsp:Transcript_85915/g.185491  ORF Transcript_85915/g.185491 Transcript_85915/m.185491 type:complete len:434 (-) Transcript_85915:1010-2311(-)
MRLILSGRPTRTAFTPSLRRPMAMLSTATLESEVARSGERSRVFDHIFMICTETCVLPVPGGPWMMVQVCRRAERTASRCDWFRWVRVFTSARARSSFSESAPPGFSFASVAAGCLLSINSAASAAFSSAFRCSSVISPPLRHCFAQLSASPTFAVIRSSETRGRDFVSRFSSAWSWRSYMVLLAPLSMRQRREHASSGQQPRSLTTIWASSRPLCGRMSAMKPSPIFSSCSPLRICCLDSEMVMESPRLNLKRSNWVFGGRQSEPISLPVSSQPIMLVFFLGSRRPKTPVHGRPSMDQPRRCSSASGMRVLRRLICRSSSRCSRCMSMQKWPKYSAACTELSGVTTRAFSRWGSSLLMAMSTSLLAVLLASCPTFFGSMIRMGSGSLFLSRITNQPPAGGPLVSRAFQARPSPPQVSRLIHHPLRAPVFSLR